MEERAAARDARRTSASKDVAITSAEGTDQRDADKIVRRNRGFSLVELVLVIATTGILAALALPECQKVIERARSAACMNNLRKIGIAVGAYLADNDNTFPFIEPNPDDPVYDPAYEATPMLAELGPYGVTQQLFKCPGDLKAGNYFKIRGSSFQWRPILDRWLGRTHFFAIKNWFLDSCR